MSDELMILVFVFFTLILILFAIGDAMFGSNRKMKARLKKMRQRMGEELPDLPQSASVLIDEKTASPGLDKIVRKFLPSTDVLNQRLARAGLKMGPGGFLAVVSVVGLLGLVIFKVIAGLSVLVSLLIGLGLGLGGAHFFIDIMIAKRQVAFTKSFPDAIDLIVRAVKSGLPVTEGISIVATEMEGPVAVEFTEISESMKIGETMEEALWNAAKRLENAEFNFFVISLVVQSETGGNLAETLGNLCDILRQRQTMKLKIRAMASEARASAYILGGLPFILIGILEVMSPGYTAPLYETGTGKLLSVAALTSIGIGAGIMFKMVRFEI